MTEYASDDAGERRRDPVYREVAAVHARLGEMNTKLDEAIEKIVRMEPIIKDVSEHERLLLGNGSQGLKVEVALLSQKVHSQQRLIAALGGGLVTLAVALVKEMVFK